MHIWINTVLSIWQYMYVLYAHLYQYGHIEYIIIIIFICHPFSHPHFVPGGIGECWNRGRATEINLHIIYAGILFCSDKINSMEKYQI